MMIVPTCARSARLVLLASLVPCAAWSQAQGSLGLGIGPVRYTGGSSFSSAALAPTFEFASPNFTTSIAGSIASLPLGVWSSQGRADLWIATPAAFGGLRVGVEGIGDGVTRTDGGWSTAAHGVAEILWAAPTWGIGLGAGPSSGWIVNEQSVTALHARARVWWRLGAANYAVNIEPTRFLGAWFTDVSAGLYLSAGPVTTSLWAATRVSPAYGSKGAGSATVQIFPLPNLAIELSGGSYLPDPYQGLPRAGYVTAGIRFFTSRRSPAQWASAPVWPALTPPRRGDSVVVRFRMEGAKAVAIAGDWNAWQPQTLSSLGEDLWEGALALPSGTYHFSLQVDGKEWVVPSGVAIITDSLGGMVGVLLVQ